MKYYRTPIKASVTKYESDKGLEDGFEFFSVVITRENVSDDDLVEVMREGQLMCPYIMTRRGKTYIKNNDYVVIEEDGTKLVCGGDKVFNRYKLIEE